jgi:hypothetical protein
MEQFTGETVRQLLEQGPGQVRQGTAEEGPAREAGAAPTHALWAKRRRPVMMAAPARLEAETPDAAQVSHAPAGVERRLPRRAELLWDRLRGSAPLPSARLAPQLLAHPFAAHALLVHPDAVAPGSTERCPQIGYAGAELEALGASTGPASADASPGAPIIARLVALGLFALATGAPAHLDSDDDPDLLPPASPLLFRAVALPLAPDAGSAGSAVVVVSWRRLLSADETADLHRELAMLLGWLSRPDGAMEARG